MMLVIERAEKVTGRELSALSRYFAEWQRKNKRHKTRLARCGYSTSEIDAEIRILRDVIKQVEVVRNMNDDHE